MQAQFREPIVCFQWHGDVDAIPELVDFEYWVSGNVITVETIFGNVNVYKGQWFVHCDRFAEAYTDENFQAVFEVI